MYLTNKNYKYQNDIINILFCFYPIAFILGNLALNINTLLLILSSFFFFHKKIFQKPFLILDKLIIVFFIYLIFVMILNLVDLSYFSEIQINHFDNPKFFLFNKSIFFLRFLFLFFVIRFLINNNIINFERFFLVSSIACLFVSFDILYQYVFDKDIFGLIPIHPRKLSGPFGAELIAGSFIQKFFLFTIFFIFIFLKVSKKNLIIFLSILIFFSAIILSGNRMPLIMAILSFFLLFVFEKKTRKYFLVGISVFFLLFILLYKNNTEVRNNYSSFYNHVTKIISYPFSSNIKRSEMPPYFDEFESFYDTWQLNKYLGAGVRSFRIYCPYRKNIDVDERSTCNTHPHNYYLEILAELGIFGLSAFIILFYKIISLSLKNISKHNQNIKQKYFFLVLFILFSIELFPFKNTGSFFSTWNSTYIFLIVSLLIGIISKKENILK